MKMSLLCLAGMLSLTTLAHAGPRPKSTPPAQPSVLSTVERQCKDLGMLAYKTARARDTGVSYLTLLEAVRRLQAPQTPEGIWLYAAHERTMRIIYDFPSLEPATLRRLTEMGCLDRVEPAATTPTATKDRY